MRDRVAGLGFIFMSATVGLVLLGCGSSNDSSGSSTGASTSEATTSTGSTGTATGGGCQFNCTSSSGTGGAGTGGSVQGTITISPMDPTLTVNGTPVPTQAFTAQYNGMDITPSTTWAFDRPEMGDIDATGLFTPTGLVAGVGQLTAMLNTTAKGSTSVTVIVTKTVNTANLTPAQIAAFDTPTAPDPTMQIVYPYDQTVFPLGVLAPEIQWNGTQAGDIYRLKLTEKDFTYIEYFTLTTTPSRHIIDQTDWSHFESSGTGADSDPVSFELARMSGTTVYQAAKQTWHIAQGKLHGSVYYWELPSSACVNGDPNGRIVRIKPDSTTVDQFFQPNTCWGCHTVSRDGTKLAAVFWDGTSISGGPSPVYEVNLAANPIAYGDINPSKPAGNTVFSAYNNDGSKLLVTENPANAQYDCSQAMVKMLDSVTGATLSPSVLTSGCSEPAWSPDGTKIAATCGLTCVSDFVYNSNTGYIVVGDVGADGKTVSNIKTIVPQAGEQGRPAYPSFSPGSGYLAFGRPTIGARSLGNGDLWIVAPDGTNVKKLATASSDNKSFNPVFAPLRAGGYYWLVFISRRDYGNELVGANRQQLWITAIDDPPSATDPSHPPFYLRGQELCGKSENAYYALDPCKQLGQSCLSGVDCCNGQCIKDSSGMYVCGTPMVGMCTADGNACKTTAECCNAPTSQCIDGFCTPPTPK